MATMSATSSSADRLKYSTPDALRALKALGIRIVMLTGDNRETAATIAQQLGIDEFESEVLPEGKLEIIRKLQGQGRVVAMAGDGINDAPALAQADVGIAMGTGTDVAMESGGITLVKGDLTGILRARKLSQATMRNIRQNLFFAFVYNAIGVPIAAGSPLSILWRPAQPHLRRRSHELQLRLGNHQRPAPAQPKVVIVGRPLIVWVGHSCPTPLTLIFLAPETRPSSSRMPAVPWKSGA